MFTQNNYLLYGGEGMNVIDKLKWLTDKEEGMGIPLIVVARYSHCHPTTLSNYLHGKS